MGTPLGKLVIPVAFLLYLYSLKRFKWNAIKVMQENGFASLHSSLSGHYVPTETMNWFTYACHPKYMTMHSLYIAG